MPVATPLIKVNPVSYTHLHALTHSSYANEKRWDKTRCNERLEFLGDAVLELVSSNFLYHQYPDMPEGEMTKLRASLVCEPTLAYCAESISLGEYLYLGKGEAVSYTHLIMSGSSTKTWIEIPM